MSSTGTETRTMVSDRFVIRLVQLLAFLAALASFPLSLSATMKYATSPFEIFIGVLLGGILACAMVIIGMLTPLAIDTHRP